MFIFHNNWIKDENENINNPCIHWLWTEEDKFYKDLSSIKHLLKQEFKRESVFFFKFGIFSLINTKDYDPQFWWIVSAVKILGLICLVSQTVNDNNIG
jgi:hypothetical protein